MSAFNTRTIKNPNMFVRTHVAFYFVSLLLSDILQCESGFIHTFYCMCLVRGAWALNLAGVYYRCGGENYFKPSDIYLWHLFSHQFNHRLGVGARWGCRIRLAMYSSRYAW